MPQPRPLFWRGRSEGDPDRWSSDVKWDLVRGEVYRARPLFIDIRKAKQIIYEKPRPVVYFEVEYFRHMVGHFQCRGEVPVPQGPVDLEVPVIMMPFWIFPKGYAPIDGWNRINEALHKCIPVLPCVLLEPEEMESCSSRYRRAQWR